MWSQFTSNNVHLMKINKFNKLFINKIKFIRSEIINIKEVQFTYSITKIPKNIINELKSSFWVSKKLSFDNLLY